MKNRKINIDDLEELRNLSIQTFKETFEEVNTEEDMQKYLDENLSIEKLKSELENPNSEFRHYNECPQWNTKIWAKAGFKIPKVKKRYLFWEREVYPKWSDLEN